MCGRVFDEEEIDCFWWRSTLICKAYQVLLIASFAADHSKMVIVNTLKNIVVHIRVKHFSICGKRTCPEQSSAWIANRT